MSGRRLSQQTVDRFARAMHPDDAAFFRQSHAAPAGSRVAGGHLARDRGAAWESWLDDQHAAAWAARIANLRHVGPPIARTGPGGENIKVIGNAPADFQGFIRGAAGRGAWRPLAVEAKSYEGRLQRHAIAPHQHVDLALVGGDVVGGVALVVIELHDAGGRSLGSWAIPYAALEARWRTSRRTSQGRTVESRSVGPEELAGWEIAHGALYLERFAGGA